MIVICIILAVIGITLGALIKASIDDRLEDLGMKGQSRLSLKRSHEAYGTYCNPVEISDDESFDISPTVQNNTRQCTNVTSHRSASVSSSVADNKCVSDNLSSDEDVMMVDDVPSIFHKNPSLFNWKSPIKRQKLNESASNSSNDESIKSNEDVSPPEVTIQTLPKVTIQHDILIAGIQVKFPVEPYKCQKAVMNSLINGCSKEQNCLLESPTGSGKTLALLCGTLAWQEQYSKKIEGEKNGMDVENSYYDNDDSCDNFLLNPSQYFDEKELHDKISCKNKPRRVPKIYYGTRTHKQIEQVVGEFKKTAYRDKRMTILSSREQTCIQETKRNKNDLCHELLDPLKMKKCPYYTEHSKNKATAFSAMNTPWDIEDLVSLGKTIGACPYFGARSLMVNADIIFCPYNYILNPDIRESMQINLKGNIVILDEAHNIEDICRETASVNLRDDEIANAAKECEHLLYKGRNRAIYDTIKEYLTDVVKFLKSIEVEVDVSDCSDREMVSNRWLGTEFRVLLDMNNIACPRFSTFHAASNTAIEDFIKSMKEDVFSPEKMMPTISRDTRRILEYLCFAMQMIISDHFVNDYRVYVVETMEYPKIAINDRISTTSKIKVRTMKLICLNPAVIFAPLARTARSVILASGTLTPTTSFQSELGTQFPHKVNPDHIVPKNQVHVRCISNGPNKKPLIATFEHVNSYDFQDELGNLILQVCDSVPYGVLCFFSSYMVMNKIYDRWNKNGIIKKLSKLKEIFVEPKDNRELPRVMKEYRSVIEESSSRSFRVACGAILFAVFRGKVAEGIDFSDNQARCVLAVGIPYLRKNYDVKMKMEYNDLNKESKNLLSGSDWYKVNAFRALNQGIGRCVRHKRDWGAVLLVDKRFQQSSDYKEHLPKWIKTNMKSNDYELNIELQNFVAVQAARERGEKEKCMEN